MAVRTFAVVSFTTEAVADAAAMANSKHMNLQGGSATQITLIKEVYCCGMESTTSSPQKLLLAFDGTLGATLTSLTTGESDIAEKRATAALAAPVVPFTASTTACQRAKAYIVPLGFNALGGLTRIRFPLNEEPEMIGASAWSGSVGVGGEISLSGFTGTTAGLIGAHIKYETL